MAMMSHPPYIYVFCMSKAKYAECFLICKDEKIPVFEKHAVESDTAMFVIRHSNVLADLDEPTNMYEASHTYIGNITINTLIARFHELPLKDVCMFRLGMLSLSECVGNKELITTEIHDAIAQYKKDKM